MEFKRAVWLKQNEWRREKQEMGPRAKRSRNQAEESSRPL